MVKYLGYVMKKITFIPEVNVLLRKIFKSSKTNLTPFEEFVRTYFWIPKQILTEFYLIGCWMSRGRPYSEKGVLMA